jgi:hypothetical protein
MKWYEYRYIDNGKDASIRRDLIPLSLVAVQALLSLQRSF